MNTINFETGEIYDLKAYINHKDRVKRVCETPYKQPVIPQTVNELYILRQNYGVHWHLLQSDITTEDMLKMNLSINDMKVLTCLIKGVIYNNYSATSVQDVINEYGISERSIYYSLKKLENMKLICDISKEITKVSARAGWRGDSSIKDNTILSEISDSISKPRGWLWSQEYRDLVNKKYS